LFLVIHNSFPDIDQLLINETKGELVYFTSWFYRLKVLFYMKYIFILTYFVRIFIMYWVVRKVRAAKDLNLINEIKNLNLLRFNFLSKSARTFRTTQYFLISDVSKNRSLKKFSTKNETLTVNYNILLIL